MIGWLIFSVLFTQYIEAYVLKYNNKIPGFHFESSFRINIFWPTLLKGVYKKTHPDIAEEKK